jgi:hypothetical protein
VPFDPTAACIAIIVGQTEPARYTVIPEIMLFAIYIYSHADWSMLILPIWLENEDVKD